MAQRAAHASWRIHRQKYGAEQRSILHRRVLWANWVQATLERSISRAILPYRSLSNHRQGAPFRITPLLVSQPRRREPHREKLDHLWNSSGPWKVPFRLSHSALFVQTVKTLARRY